LAKFCYDFTKHSAIKTNPFKLALEVEVKQPMDLAIFRTKGTHHEGNKEAKAMTKECEERKSWANKLRKHIEFEVEDLVQLNIKDFKMPKILANRFIPKYVGPYKVILKPHLDVYTLQLPMTLVAHQTFHVSKLKPVHEDTKKKDQK